MCSAADQSISQLKLFNRIYLFSIINNNGNHFHNQILENRREVVRTSSRKSVQKEVLFFKWKCSITFAIHTFYCEYLFKCVKIKIPKHGCVPKSPACVCCFFLFHSTQFKNGIAKDVVSESHGHNLERTKFETFSLVVNSNSQF